MSARATTEPLSFAWCPLTAPIPETMYRRRCASTSCGSTFRHPPTTTGLAVPACDATPSAPPVPANRGHIGRSSPSKASRSLILVVAPSEVTATIFAVNTGSHAAGKLSYAVIVAEWSSMANSSYRNPAVPQVASSSNRPSVFSSDASPNDAPVIPYTSRAPLAPFAAMDRSKFPPSSNRS